MRLTPTLNGRGGQGVPRRLMAIIAVAAIVIVGLAVTSWIYSAVNSGDDAAVGEHHDGGGIDMADARSAASSALSTMYSWTPATDRSPADALERALPQLTGTARMQAQERTGPVRPIAHWSRWAQEKTIVTATVPTDTMTDVPIGTSPHSTTVRAKVTQFLQPVDAAPSTYAKFTVRVSLERSGSQWLVSKFEVSDFG